jgi:hypothetical protein
LRLILGKHPQRSRTNRFLIATIRPGNSFKIDGKLQKHREISAKKLHLANTPEARYVFAGSSAPTHPQAVMR